MGKNSQLRDKSVWVFDLDNTLYSPKTQLFSQIQVKMNQFVANFLGLSQQEARIVQKKYYVEYGTTLNGLMKHHDVNPQDYLHHVHDIDYSAIAQDLRLKEAIASLDARKIVFTNGSKRHAENAIDALGLNGTFEDIIDIEATNFLPKPHKKAFEILVEKSGFDPKTAVMVEDLHKNLISASELGFTTVLVYSDHDWPDEPKGHAPAGKEDLHYPHLDFTTDDLAGFLQNISREA